MLQYTKKKKKSERLVENQVCHVVRMKHMKCAQIKYKKFFNFLIFLQMISLILGPSTLSLTKKKD